MVLSASSFILCGGVIEEDRYLVCFVYLVDLVHLVSFVQPKNQTDQTNQTDQMNQTGWRAFSASC
jgi:hypothetical protein